MSAESVVTTIGVDDAGVKCWCCGAVDSPLRMVHLGQHPEVNLCLRCAHFVHQRAWAIEDQGMRGATAVTRHGFRSLRAEVMRKGWHRRRFLGRPLRRLGRHLP